MKSDFEV